MYVTSPVDGIALVLLEDRHAESVFALVDQDRGHLRCWLPWVDLTRSPDDIRAFIKLGLQQFVDNGGFNAGIWVDETLAGVIGYHKVDWTDRKTEIGYWLGAAFERRGLMTRACRQMIDYAFKELRLNRLEIHCAVDNRGSRAVAERLGFAQEAFLRQAEWLNDRFVDHVIYAMLAEDWSRLRTSS